MRPLISPITPGVNNILFFSFFVFFPFSADRKNYIFIPVGYRVPTAFHLPVFFYCFFLFCRNSRILFRCRSWAEPIERTPTTRRTVTGTSSLVYIIHTRAHPTDILHLQYNIISRAHNNSNNKINTIIGRGCGVRTSVILYYIIQTYNTIYRYACECVYLRVTVRAWKRLPACVCVCTARYARG